MIGRHHHGLVAGDVGLRREHVHALRARGAGRRFQRECGDIGRSQARRVVVVERIEHADQHRARLHLRQLRRFRRAHLQHDLRTERFGGGADPGAGRHIGFVRLGGSDAGARLHRDLVALRDVLLHRLRGRGNARLVRPRLLRDADVHRVLLVVVRAMRNGAQIGFLLNDVELTRTFWQADRP